MHLLAPLLLLARVGRFVVSGHQANQIRHAISTCHTELRVRTCTVATARLITWKGKKQ